MKGLIRSTATAQKRLRAAGFPSVVIGGLAVAVWGEPRLTKDVDLKVLVSREGAPRLVAAAGAWLTPLDGDAEQSLSTLGFAFFKDRANTRIDLLLADTTFDESAVARGVEIKLAGRARVRVCTAEDLVIYKLVATRPRDHEDARGVIKRQAKALDDSYILEWLRQFEEALDDSTLVAAYQALRR